VTDSTGDVVELARIQPDGSLGDPAGAAEAEANEGGSEVAEPDVAETGASEIVEGDVESRA
jgi:hypothetical protein